MALLTVLLLVAVMAAVAVLVLDDIRFSVRRTMNAETQSQAQWYAAGPKPWRGVRSTACATLIR